MILNLFQSKRKRQLAQTAQRLYHDCVAQARQPFLYRDCAIPDTVDGRFDAIILHLYLTIGRLLDYDHSDSAYLQQKLFDTMFYDMDRNLREMGVGDLGVPKRIKKMMLAFNGRIHAYAAARGRDEMVLALRKNIYRDTPVAQTAIDQLYDYVQQQKSDLQKWSFDDFLTANRALASAA